MIGELECKNLIEWMKERPEGKGKEWADGFLEPTKTCC